MQELKLQPGRTAAAKIRVFSASHLYNYKKRGVTYM